MKAPSSQQSSRSTDYERITRRVRWIIIGSLAATLPLDQPQAPIMWALLALGTVFNLTRYLPLLMKQRWYASYMTMLVADNLMVAGLIIVVGRVDLPYTGLLGLIIITATYKYGIKGTFGVIGSQLAVLGFAATSGLFPALAIDPVRALVLACTVLFTFGLLLEQLTRVEREQRDTLRKLEREQSLVDSRLMALVNSLGDAVAAIDSKGNITVANAALNEVSGADGSLKDKAISDILHLKHAFKKEFDWSDALRSAPGRYRDYFLAGSGDKQTSIELSITPVGNQASGDGGYIVSCHDITKDKSLDEERQEFIAVTSHELRTPITIIEGSLSLALISKETMDPKMRALLEQAHRSVEFLGGLVQDLSLLAKAQNDNIEVQPQVVDPKKLVEQLVGEYSDQAKEKGLSLTTEVKSDVPTVLTTERHVEEILRNLISNGIKYTDKGGVVLSAELAQKNSVLFSVKDTGVGISQPDQKRLFTKFFRAEDFQTRQIGGSGLGLYICQEVATRINAKLWCSSELGKGSTFFLEVPPFSKLDKDQGKVVTAGVSNLVDQI
jgi:two-component system phosphate regulon sensor histidine kinase PhoR